MRIASPPLLMMATRTDKEARLKDFITEGLARLPEASAAADPVTIVVRNPDSPAARAAYAALSERHVGSGVKVIFGETNSDDPMAASLLDIICGEFRVLGDPRFGAAHEQFVVGTHVGPAIACVAIRTSVMLSKFIIPTMQRSGSTPPVRSKSCGPRRGR